MNLSAWSRLTDRRIEKILDIARCYMTLKRLGPKTESWKVDIELVTLEKMKELNSFYRGIKNPTDILSFPTGEPFYSAGYLGALVICLQVLKKQAKEFKTGEKNELDILLIHGFLHLLGLDHEQGKRKADEMRKWEEKLISAIKKKASPGLIGRSA